jgi:hypothetical protein
MKPMPTSPIFIRGGIGVGISRIEEAEKQWTASRRHERVNKVKYSVLSTQYFILGLAHID